MGKGNRNRFYENNVRTAVLIYHGGVKISVPVGLFFKRTFRLFEHILHFTFRCGIQRNNTLRYG